MGGTDNNDSDDSDVYNESSARRIANEKKTNVLVKSLLSSTINRASRTMSNLSNNDDDGGSGSGSGSGSGGTNNSDYDSDGFTTSQNDSVENGIQNLMETVISRSSNNNDNDNNNNNNNNDSVVTKVVESKDKGSACSIIGKADKKQHQDKRQYLANPAVTPTALAHSLWAEVIQPYTDTVIDATCGNGKDALILANLLFPSHHHQQQQLDMDMDMDMDNNEIQHPQLIGIDIQRQACENTVRLLNDNLPSQIVSDNIQILHSSHAPLSIPLSTASVGLICYNLGYLPGTDNKRVSTEMMTTLYSITDAALMLRLGGLLSIMTYPGSSYLEYCAVSYFVEGLAMFTSKNDWRDFVDSVPNDEELLRQADARHGSYNHKGNDEGLCESSTVRDCVKIALKRVMDKGDKKQTWRSFDHRPLGRPYSPILFTAMRIK